jgi:hypothetical protein
MKPVEFHYIRLEGLAGYKHSSFLGPFVSYEGSEVMKIRKDPGTEFTTLHFHHKLCIDLISKRVSLH